MNLDCAAQKRPLLMQSSADVAGRTMLEAGSSPPPFTRCGLIAARKAVYARLYAVYRQLRDRLGGLIRSAGLSRLTKELIDIRYAPYG